MLLDFEIKTRNFDLKKIMKKFKKQCNSSKNSNKRVYIVKASDTDVRIRITYTFLAL